jgi:hypothetical protein
MPDDTNENLPGNGWTQYGKLVLAELKRLTEGQEKINETLGKLTSQSDKVDDIDEWKDKVIEVWSVTQMKEVKDEVYTQKNKMHMIWGMIVLGQFILMILMGFKDQIFGG